MFERTLLWGISALGQTQLNALEGLLQSERAANPQLQAYGAITAGPAIDAERNGLPITIRDNIAIIPVRGIMLKKLPVAQQLRHQHPACAGGGAGGAHG